MKLTISIPDDLYETIAGLASSKLAVERHIVQTLERYGTVKPGDRVIVLYPDERRQVEEVFRTTVENAADLVTKLRHLAMFKIGPVERPLDASELAILRDQASFHGSDPETYLRFCANDIIDRTLGRV